jgi:putative nucleotidyltransferase with HDIG domain
LLKQSDILTIFNIRKPPAERIEKLSSFNGGDIRLALEKDKRFLEEIVRAVPFLADQEGEIINLHSARVAILSSAFSAEILESNRFLVMMAGLYHDIGAIGSNIHPVRAKSIVDFFSNPWLSNHPIRAAQVLKKIDFLKPISNIVLEHHEWYDGGGFPFGKKSSEILPEAQALRISDAFDVAMLITGNANYAFEILQKLKGKEIDEDLYIIFKHYVMTGDFDFLWKDEMEVIATIIDFWRKIKLNVNLGDVLNLLKVFELKSKPQRDHFLRVAFLTQKVWEEMGTTEALQASRAAIIHEVYTSYEPFKGPCLGSIQRLRLLQFFPILEGTYSDIESDPMLSEVVNTICYVDRALSQKPAPFLESELISVLAEFNGRVNPEVILVVKKVLEKYSLAIYEEETIKSRFS